MAGGGSSRYDEGKKKARIEIIPLIDVIFFLLATFVLFTLTLSRIVSIPVQLPQAQTQTSKPDETMVTIQMSAAGTCYWKHGATGSPELITVSDIEPRLEDYKAHEQNPHVLVSGDSQAKFGAIVLALDEVRKAGIDQVSVETDRVPPTGRF